MNISFKSIDAGIPPSLKKMRDLYSDLFSDGKQYRGALVQMLSDEIGLSEDKANVLSRTAEFIHNSSLLHDDVLDNSTLRRGKTAAWKKYGGSYAILAGDYLLARVIKDLCVLSHLEIIEYTSETILELIEGEWLQDENFKKIDIKEDRIKEVHRLKTGALFSWCFKAPFLLSDKSKSDVIRAYKVGEIFGHLLQRSDDLLDFDIRNFENKEFFKDLPSGNLNLFAFNMIKDKEQNDKAYSFKTMNDFLEFYSIDLTAEVKKFDSQSLEMILELQNLIDEFDDFSKEFKENLKVMSQLIYWRTSDKSQRY